MAQQFISNGEPGLAARNALNSNFTELYAAVPVTIKQAGITGNFNQGLPANTFISMITLFPVSGSPTVRIGTTPNGEEIYPDTVIDTTYTYYPIQVQQWFKTSGTLYFTLSSGSGSFDIRIDEILNYN